MTSCPKQIYRVRLWYTYFQHSQTLVTPYYQVGHMLSFYLENISKKLDKYWDNLKYCVCILDNSNPGENQLTKTLPSLSKIQ